MDPLRDRLRRLVSGLPDGASVTLPRAVLVSWLEDAGEAAHGLPDGDQDRVADLTVPELAEALGRAENTVRGWMPDVPGAYKLGAEWRVSRRAWRAHLATLAEDDSDTDPPPVRSDRTADLGAWREKRGGAA